MKINQGVSPKSTFNEENLTQLICDDENIAEFALHNAYFQEIRVRTELCSALASLNSSMRSLMGLIGRHNFITTIPEATIPKYREVMEAIGTAVVNATNVIEKSHALDKRSTLDISNFNGRPQ